MSEQRRLFRGRDCSDLCRNRPTRQGQPTREGRNNPRPSRRASRGPAAGSGRGGCSIDGSPRRGHPTNPISIRLSSCARSCAAWSCARSFTPTWCAAASAEEPDCSDLVPTKAVADQAGLPSGRNNPKVGTIGVRRSPGRGARSSSLPLACRPRVEQTGYRIRGLGRSVAPDCPEVSGRFGRDPSFASAGAGRMRRQDVRLAGSIDSLRSSTALGRTLAVAEMREPL